MLNWSLQKIWNETLLEEQRQVEPRDYIRASEVGTSFIDRYYKMTGEPFTNQFNARTLRVFEAGRLYEWLVRLVLIRAGILRSQQFEVKIEGEHLPVIGHLDFIAGGKPDWEQAKTIVPILESLDFPINMMVIALKVVEQLQDNFPNRELPQVVYEIKSINSMVFWKHNKNETLTSAYKHHALQVYTYMKGLGFNEGRVLYISKDDLTLAEVQVTVDALLDNEWRHDIMKMSEYYRKKELPPVPPFIVWNRKKYELNWHITRSNYFTKITGVADEDQEAWMVMMTKLCNRANYRVKEALKKKADLTPEQLQILCDPYVQQQLDQIKDGKIRIEKMISLEDEE